MDQQHFSHFIVLSGEAGAGKDSVADILCDRHDYRKVSLSDDMKRFCMQVFGWTHEQVFGQSSFRNVPDPRWAQPCSPCGGTGYITLTSQNDRQIKHATCDGMGKLNVNSPRRVLQLLGSEWGRDMIHPDIWTMAARSRLLEMKQRGYRIVINDARFENDRNNLAQWFGAKRVDVRTTNVKAEAEWRQHASETSRPSDDNVDYVINNNEPWPFNSLQGKVETMINDLYHEF